MPDDNKSRDRRLILVELNEINFDVAIKYVGANKLRAFAQLLAGPSIRTSSERDYEKLEPWIQWPSVHCGLAAEEHRIFRLGDIVHSGVPQVFELLESHGLRVGVVSAMNAANRLRNPAYFIPDPWTRTPPDNSWWSRALSNAVSQAVNDNAQQRLTLTSAIHLALGLLRFARPKHYLTYLRLAARSLGAPWRKALFLDLLLHDIHMRLFTAKRAHFSALFLNAGAHIQHHYFFNAKALHDQLSIRNPSWYVDASVDPFAEMLEVYDLILRDYLALPDTDIIVATGLSQRPYDRVKFYYRPKDHARLLRELGVEFRTVLPRMTRDFLVEFDTIEQALAAQIRLESVTVNDGEPLFGEIDNRGTSLFLTLTYPHEITADTRIRVDSREFPLQPHVAFVALKNGMHQETGFAFFSSNVARFAPRDGGHVGELYETITRFFSVASGPALDGQMRSLVGLATESL